MYLDYIKLVLRDINRRKFSSFLTLFAISLGILTIFVIFLLGQGFESSIEDQFNQFGANRVYITAATTNFASSTVVKGLTETEAELLESRPYIEEVFTYYTRTAQVEFGNEFQTIPMFGTQLSQDYFDAYNIEIQEGRFPNPNERYSVVIGPLAATDTYDKNIRVGSNLYVNGVKFKVVGIFKSLGNPTDDSYFYFNIDTLREIYDGGEDVGFLEATIVEGYDVELAADNIEILLENRLGEDSVNIMTPSQLLEQVSSILDIVKYSLGGIAFVSLIVGALGIVNTMYVIVTEKKKEIGIMKSVGAKNTDILFIFVFHAGLFGLLGAILGVGLGSLAALGFEAVAQASGFAFLQIKILPSAVIGLLIFGFTVGALSGLLPALRASKTNIIEAIRKS